MDARIINEELKQAPSSRASRVRAAKCNDPDHRLAEARGRRSRAEKIRMEHYTLQIVAAADFRLTQALYRFTLSSYRGREGRQVNQSLARGTSQISAINQSLSFRAGSRGVHDSTRDCRAAYLRSRMPRKVPHGYSRHANIDHASPSRKRYAKAKRGACLPIAGYSQRCFARRSLSRRPRSVETLRGLRLLSGRAITARRGFRLSSVPIGARANKARNSTRS